ncbi:MAG: NAD(P)/FAD-dependent oxidoreductase [Methanomicrobia archaeon]|nr:NAD(P)/FAD-dependent oxidoreductase [Methanomicrobia archaeon]
MEIECDVLVVGAGPAGSVAALYCSKHGLDTVLIDKNDKVGAHITTRVDSSTDLGLTSIINELELRTENLVHNSKWHSAFGNSFTLHSDIGEYYVKRGPDSDSFECSTVQKAVVNGCTFFGQIKIEKLCEDSEGVSEIILLQGEKTIAIHPKIVIAADGSNSIFHRYIRKKLVSNRVAYGVTGNYFAQPDTSEIYFNVALAPGGYFYIASCPQGLSSAGIVLDSSKMDHSAHSYFYNYLNKNQEIAKRLNRVTNNFQGCEEIFDLDVHTYKNILLIGNAAGLIDPFLGYGVMPAIVSSYRASKYSVDAIKNHDMSVLQNYNEFIKQHFTKDLAYLYRKILNTLNDEDLDLIIGILNMLQRKIDIGDLLCFVDM